MDGTRLGEKLHGREMRPMTERLLRCVLLADRHHGLAEGVRGMLETAFQTVVMVADEASLLEAAVRLRPDAAVLDLSLSKAGSLECLRALRLRCPDLRVVVVSVHDEQSVRLAAVNAGADAFVLKRAIATDLLPAIDRVRENRDAPALADEPRKGNHQRTRN